MKHSFLLSCLLCVSITLLGQAPVKISDLQKKEKIYYLDGKPFTGSCYEKHPNDKIGLKGQFKNGMKDGMWMWWYSSGAKKRETTYIDNRKEGMTFYWHQNGVKAKELLFKNDKNIDQKLWDENGNRLPSPSFMPIMD